MVPTIPVALGAQSHTQAPTRSTARNEGNPWSSAPSLRPTPQVPARPSATALVVCEPGLVRDRIVRGLAREGWRVVTADDADDAFRCLTGRRAAPAPSNRAGRRAPADLASVRRFDLIVSAVALPWLDSEVLGVVPPLMAIDLGAGAPIRCATAMCWPFTESQVAVAASRAVHDEN